MEEDGGELDEEQEQKDAEVNGSGLEDGGRVSVGILSSPFE